MELRPTASPVDTFAASEVRARSTNAQSLSELAGALQNLNPQLQQVSMRFAEDRRKQTIDKVRADLFDNRVRNKKDFLELVDSGKIHWSNSPFAMEFAEQIVSQNETTDLFRQIDADIESNANGLRYANVDDIDKHIESKVVEMASKRSDISKGIIADMSEKFRDEILTKHANRLSKDREVATKTDFAKSIVTMSNDVSSALSDGVINDDEASSVAERMSTQIQLAIQNGIPKAEVAGWTLDALKSQALASKNAGVLDSLLSRVSVDGGVLKDYIPESEIEQTRTNIEEMNIAEEMNRDKVQRLRRDRAMESFKVTIGNRLAESVQAGKPLDISSFKIEDFDPEYRVELKQFMDEYKKQSDGQQIDALQTQYINTVLAGKPDMSIISAISAFTTGGAQGVTQALSMEKSIKDVRDSDPKVLFGLLERVFVKGENLSQIWGDMQSAASTGKLTELSVRDLIGYANRERRPAEQEITRAFMTRLDLTKRKLISMAMNDPQNIYTTESGSQVLLPQVEQAIEMRLMSISSSFLDRTITDYNDAHEYGKSALEELLSSVSSITPAQKAPTPVTVDAQASPDKITALTFDPTIGDLVDKVTKEPARSVRIFSNDSDFYNRSEMFIAQTGIDLKTPQGQAVLQRQVQPLGGRAKVHAWKLIASATKGPEEASKGVSALALLDKQTAEITKFYTHLDKARKKAATEGQQVIRLGSVWSGQIEYTHQDAMDLLQEKLKEIEDIEKIRERVYSLEYIPDVESLSEELKGIIKFDKPRGKFKPNWWDRSVAYPSGQNFAGSWNAAQRESAERDGTVPEIIQ